MAKLIYAQSAAGFEAKYKNNSWQTKPGAENLDSPYYSVAFTNDGYLYTHGRKFKLSTVEGDKTGIYKLGLDGASLSLKDGESILSSVTLPVISVKGDAVISASNKDSTVYLEHKMYNSALDKATAYTPGVKSGKLTTHGFTLDKYGHISAITPQELDIAVVKTSINTNGKVFLTGASSTGAVQALNTHSSVYMTGGALSAASFSEGGTLISKIYAPISAFKETYTPEPEGVNKTYGATTTHAGLVQLDNSIDSSNKTTGFAATPGAVNAAYTKAIEEAKKLFGTNDAMIFAGTVSAEGIIQSYNTSILSASVGVTNINNIDLKAGWTFKFTKAGNFTYASESNKVETGDMLICVVDLGSGKAHTKSDISIIQNNLDNVVTSAGKLTSGCLVVGDTTRGIKTKASSTAGKYLAGDLRWEDYKYREIKVAGISKLSDTSSTALNFINGDGITISWDSNSVKISNSYTPLTSAEALTFYNNATSPAKIAAYNPNGVPLDFVLPTTLYSYTAGSNGKNSKITLKEHIALVSNSNEDTYKLYKISIDTYGHVNGKKEVSSLKNPNALTIKSGSSLNLTYDGSAAQTLNIVGDGMVSVTSSKSDNGHNLTISATQAYKKMQIQLDKSTTIISESNAASFSFKAGPNVTLSGASKGNVLTISSTNTWRNVYAYVLSSTEISEILKNSINTLDLQFGNEFAWAPTSNKDNEMKLVWAEIDSSGNVTYAV